MSEPTHLGGKIQLIEDLSLTRDGVEKQLRSLGMHKKEDIETAVAFIFNPKGSSPFCKRPYSLKIERFLNGVILTLTATSEVESSKLASDIIHNLFETTLPSLLATPISLDRQNYTVSFRLVYDGLYKPVVRGQIPPFK